MSTSTSCEGAKPQVRPTENGCSAASCVPLVQSEQDVAHMNTDQTQKRFRISNMDCASEESEIRRAVDGIPEIEALRFDLGARVLTISASQAALPNALQAIRKAGFKPEPIDEADKKPSGTTNASATFWDMWGKLLAALGLALAAEAIAYAFPATTWIKALGMAIALGAIFLSGFGVYGKGLAALRQGRLNINALMAVAVTGAFLIGQWPEAAMVMALYAIAEAIEARAVDRARGAIKSLLALSPEQAEVRQADGGFSIARGLLHHPWRTVSGARRSLAPDLFALGGLCGVDVCGALQPLQVRRFVGLDHGEHSLGARGCRVGSLAVRSAFVGGRPGRLHYAGGHFGAQRHFES